MNKQNTQTNRERALAAAASRGFSKKLMKELVTRQTGKTTANILQAISKAMLNPRKEVEIKDHAFKYADNSIFYRKAVLPMAEEIIKTLRLKGFTLSKTGRTIKYDFNF